MATNRKLEPDREALLRRAVEEQRAVNPCLFEPRPLSEDVTEQLLQDEVDVERIWDEMERTRDHTRRRYTAEEVVRMDRDG